MLVLLASTCAGQAALSQDEDLSRDGFLGMSVFRRNSAAERSSEKPPGDFDPQGLLHARVNVTLSSGETLVNLEVTDVAAGPAKGTVRSVTLNADGGKKPTRLAAVKIRCIEEPGCSPCLVYDRKRHMLAAPEKTATTIPSGPSKGHGPGSPTSSRSSP